jgi:hypothetical protein
LFFPTHRFACSFMRSLKFHSLLMTTEWDEVGLNMYNIVHAEPETSYGISFYKYYCTNVKPVESSTRNCQKQSWSKSSRSVLW